jgi:hypothetical protein
MASKFVRFEVLTAASMMFRIVFWDVLPCKIIIYKKFFTNLNNINVFDECMKNAVR